MLTRYRPSARGKGCWVYNQAQSTVFPRLGSFLSSEPLSKKIAFKGLSLISGEVLIGEREREEPPTAAWKDTQTLRLGIPPMLQLDNVSVVFY